VAYIIHLVSFETGCFVVLKIVYTSSGSVEGIPGCDNLPWVYGAFHPHAAAHLIALLIKRRIRTIVLCIPRIPQIMKRRTQPVRPPKASCATGRCQVLEQTLSQRHGALVGQLGSAVSLGHVRFDITGRHYRNRQRGMLPRQRHGVAGEQRLGPTVRPKCIPLSFNFRNFPFDFVFAHGTNVSPFLVVGEGVEEHGTGARSDVDDPPESRVQEGEEAIHDSPGSAGVGVKYRGEGHVVGDARSRVVHDGVQLVRPERLGEGGGGRLD